MATAHGTTGGYTADVRKVNWGLWIKISLLSVAAVAIAYLVGAYAVGPGRITSQDGYVPAAVSQLPAASISISNPDGSAAFLPVRLAETPAARTAGLSNVGPRALETTFLLYDHAVESRPVRYGREGIRAPLDLAIINGQGQVVAVRQVTASRVALSVSEPHRWALATKQGLLEHYGIVVGSQLDVENIRRKD